MKTILSLVDFSDASTNSLSFAAGLAKRASSRLIIIHIVKKGEDEEEAKDKLESIVSDLKKSFGSDLNCDSSLEHGHLIPTLNEIIDVQKPDLIVMGTKGASGLKRIFIGSNTVDVISKTRVPVLVIPEKAKYENFHNRGKKRIILATDLESLENKDAINILIEIASLSTDPIIRVLSVRPEDSELSKSERSERHALLSLFNPEIECESITVVGNNVIHGIDFYLSKRSMDTGLISMVARDSGSLIQRHYTREMASHTHLPLLVMHDSKI